MAALSPLELGSVPNKEIPLVLIPGRENWFFSVLSNCNLFSAIVNGFIERDGLLHVQWKLRPSNDTQQDYIVMPNEATVELVPECTDGNTM